MGVDARSGRWEGEGKGQGRGAGRVWRVENWRGERKRCGIGTESGSGRGRGRGRRSGGDVGGGGCNVGSEGDPKQHFVVFKSHRTLQAPGCKDMPSLRLSRALPFERHLNRPMHARHPASRRIRPNHMPAGPSLWLRCIALARRCAAREGESQRPSWQSGSPIDAGKPY